MLLHQPRPSRASKHNGSCVASRWAARESYGTALRHLRLRMTRAPLEPDSEPTAGYLSLSCAQPLAACSGRLCGGAAIWVHRLPRPCCRRPEAPYSGALSAQAQRGCCKLVQWAAAQRCSASLGAQMQARFARCDWFAAAAARARRSSPRGAAHACHARGAVARPYICGPCGSRTHLHAVAQWASGCAAKGDE